MHTLAENIAPVGVPTFSAYKILEFGSYIDKILFKSANDWKSHDFPNSDKFLLVGVELQATDHTFSGSLCCNEISFYHKAYS